MKKTLKIFVFSIFRVFVIVLFFSIKKQRDYILKNPAASCEESSTVRNSV